MHMTKTTILLSFHQKSWAERVHTLSYELWMRKMPNFVFLIFILTDCISSRSGSEILLSREKRSHTVEPPIEEPYEKYPIVSTTKNIITTTLLYTTTRTTTTTLPYTTTRTTTTTTTMTYLAMPEFYKEYQDEQYDNDFDEPIYMQYGTETPDDERELASLGVPDFYKEYQDENNHEDTQENEQQNDDSVEDEEKIPINEQSLPDYNNPEDETEESDTPEEQNNVFGSGNPSSAENSDQAVFSANSDESILEVVTVATEIQGATQPSNVAQENQNSENQNSENQSSNAESSDTNQEVQDSDDGPRKFCLIYTFGLRTIGKIGNRMIWTICYVLLKFMITFFLLTDVLTRYLVFIKSTQNIK